jgi:hypothetical protein
MKQGFIHNDRTWKSENLSSITFLNGDPIIESKSDNDWFQNGRKGIPTFKKIPSSDGDIDVYLYNYYCFNDERGLIPDGFRISTTDELQSLILNEQGEFINQYKIPTNTGYITKGGKHSLTDFGAYWGCNLDGIYPNFILLKSRDEDPVTTGSDSKACGYAVRLISKPNGDDRDFIKKVSLF